MCHIIIHVYNIIVSRKKANANVIHVQVMYQQNCANWTKQSHCHNTFKGQLTVGGQQLLRATYKAFLTVDKIQSVAPRFIVRKLATSLTSNKQQTRNILIFRLTQNLRNFHFDISFNSYINDIRKFKREASHMATYLDIQTNATNCL